MKEFLNRKDVKNTIALVFFFLSCIAVFRAFNMMFNIIGGDFIPLEEYCGYVIVYFLVPMYLFLYYRNYFVRKSNNFWLWLFVISTIASKVFALTMHSLAFEELYGNFKYNSINLLFPFDVYIVALFEFIVDGYIVFKAIKMNGNVTYMRYINKKTSMPLCIVSGVGMVLSMYYIGAGFNGVYGLKNILYDYGFGYLILLLMFLSPAFTICSVFSEHDKNKTSAKFQLAGFILSTLSILLFIIYKSIYPSFEVAVGKPLLEIDFYGSMLIGTTITLLLNLSVVIRFIVKVIITKKNIKKEVGA